MKAKRIISIFLTMILVTVSLTSCFGFATAEKPKEWVTMKLNVAVKYLIYVDEDHQPNIVDAEFGVDNYEFEYCPEDMPNPNPLDVLSDLAYIEYDKKVILDDTGKLKSVGEFQSGTYDYNEISYSSSWILSMNGQDCENAMNSYVVKEGDTIVFYLYLIDPNNVK